MGVLQLTTGAPGTGKTYVRCAKFLVDDYLINNRGTLHISNFPVNVDAVAKAVYRRQRRLSYRLFSRLRTESLEEIKSRIVLIPQEVQDKWRRGWSTPADYFAGQNLVGCHIALDEFHEFLNVNSSVEVVQKWEDWLATIRHLGCTIEALTQDSKSVNPVYLNRVSERIELFSAENEREPLLKISLYDWAQLKAGLTGKYRAYGVECLKRKQASGYWKIIRQRVFSIDDWYFQFYNSFNNTKGDNEENAGIKVHEYQRKGKLGIIFWFLNRNIWHLLLRFAMAGLFVWLCFFGGVQYLVKKFLEMTETMAKCNASVQSMQTEKVVEDEKSNMHGSEMPVEVDVKADNLEIAEFEQAQKIEMERERQRILNVELMTESYIVLQNGMFLNVGDKIKRGGKDVQLLEIRQDEGICRFDNDYIGVVSRVSRNAQVTREGETPQPTARKTKAPGN